MLNFIRKIWKSFFIKDLSITNNSIFLNKNKIIIKIYKLFYFFFNLIMCIRTHKNRKVYKF